MAVLESIYHANQDIRQRDLARIVGVSLGMTNAIVRRLAQKGLLTIRKLNSRNVRYAVSSAGIEAMSRRTVDYVKRTVRNVVLYREAVGRMVRGARARGYRTVRLVGQSDIGFIVEHACAEARVSFCSGGEPLWADDCFNLFSETDDRPPDGDCAAGASLRLLLMEAIGQDPVTGSVGAIGEPE
jgi:hypothetical protein